jgi:ElaB/YqjD/DUF883 family membrane-anchored ribosome-binding protein
MAEANVEKLMEDLRQVVVDVEDLLKATAGQAGERLGEARHRAEQTLSAARERLSALAEDAAQRARAAAREADDYVRDHPWQSVGIAAGVGFLVGLLVSRRS